jgi:NTP pyrophosphatase (non-canonical NTP hydrolase)
MFLFQLNKQLNSPSGMLKQFDSELLECGTYVKMYCKSSNIECVDLNRKVEKLNREYYRKGWTLEKA